MKLEQVIEKFTETVAQDALALVHYECQQQGLKLTEQDVEMVEIGVNAGSGMLMQTLTERGWLNARKMTDDMNAEVTA